jgi:methionyl-tRNA synthetase
MIGKYFDGRLPAAGDLTEAETAVVDLVADASARADAAIDELAPHDAVAAVWEIVELLNGYLAEQQPWQVAKQDLDRTGTILATAAEGLRALCVLLAPVLPKATLSLWESLGAAEAIGPLADQRVGDVATWGQLPVGTPVTKGAVLFPRIEVEGA